MYRKRSNFKRRPRRRYARKTGGGWMGTAQKALKLAKYVAGLVNAEHKYYEISSTGFDPTFNGTIVRLCAPGQGVAATQREGDSIKVKNLTLKSQIIIGNTNEIVRVIVLRENQTTITAGSQVLQGAGTTLGVLGNKNQDNKFDSKILYDKCFTLNNVNVPMVKFNIKLKIDSHINFDAGSTNAASGDIKLLVFNQSAASGLLFRYDSYCTYMDN